jgi:predicted ATP-dependent endonuclease of OLD family
MYVKRISIKNYRNFGDPPFVLDLKPFTLLLGENNVGKTNLLNAIALLFSQEIGITQRRLLEVDDLNYGAVVASRLKSRGAIPLEAGRLRACSGLVMG